MMVNLIFKVDSALVLWNKYKAAMSVDFFDFQENVTLALAEQYALQHIQSILNQFGKHMSDFGLPFPKRSIGDFRTNNPYVATPTIEDHIHLANLMYHNLNNEQRAAFDEIMVSMFSTHDESKCFFLDGPGGTGKTYLIDVSLFIIYMC